MNNQRFYDSLKVGQIVKIRQDVSSLPEHFPNSKGAVPGLLSVMKKMGGKEGQLIACGTSSRESASWKVKFAGHAITYWWPDTAFVPMYCNKFNSLIEREE